MKRQRARHYGGSAADNHNPKEEEEEDEDDAFSRLSKKKRKDKKASSSSSSSSSSAPKAPVATTTTATDSPSATSGTKSSSTSVPMGKRHHFVTSERQAKMDALLEELTCRTNSTTAGGAATEASRPPPEKRGSFVEAGEEWSTTNIFVGNLAPSITEEELTETFRQFGDLYSVKIMWPRTDEERARNRNTGFVCFMNRPDAQEAMDALQDSDALGVGRRLLLRWGKNVKKTVKRGTGGVVVFARKKTRNEETARTPHKKEEEPEEQYRNDKYMDTRRRSGSETKRTSPSSSSSSKEDPYSQLRKREEEDETTRDPWKKRRKVEEEESAAAAPVKRESGRQGAIRGPPPPVYDAAQHAATAIRVVPPADLHRRQFITTVASFVAKDGSILERRLMEKESHNAQFSFLHPQQDNLEERIFYRWRVYAFCQGDGFDSWRTEPFCMWQTTTTTPPSAPPRFWIPPPIVNTHAARQEEEAAQRKEVEIRSKQEERRKLSQRKREYMTGRQLERAKQEGLEEAASTAAAKQGAALLSPLAEEQFKDLLQHKLCASRTSIEEAMAFCLEHAGAAQQVAQLLCRALLQGAGGRGVSVDTRIARLYLLSDVLFNSQQPGVRNAFCYRNAFAELAPDVFQQLGRMRLGGGRWTLEKLRQAVQAVLRAWTQWSVYNTSFLEDLQARFDGTERVEHKKEEAEQQEPEKEGENLEEEKQEEKDDEREKQQGEKDMTLPPEELGDTGESKTEQELQQTTATSKVVQPKQEWTDVTEVQVDPKDEEDDNGKYDGEPLEEDDYPLILVATE